MLVYGDRWRRAAPVELLDDIACRLAAAGADADRLTAALILAGELAQGVADAEATGPSGFADDLTPGHAATMALAIAVAARLLAACGQPAAGVFDPGGVGAALARVRALPLPQAIRCRSPEGFAFYALYPEAYAAAAAAPGWPVPPLVIGIRSIGTSLGAIVAARLGCAALTVRPVGHPFRRELRLAKSLRARLARHPGPFIVVDEGPGLSGSSFGSVGDGLAALGVSQDRIVYMPGHANGPGRHVTQAHCARWNCARRLPAAGPGPATVLGWFADLAGPGASAEDLSAGGWRRDLPAPLWPPAAPVAERLKFRLTGPQGRFLARFAGLGDMGEAKLDLARRLHRAGFTPEPLALRHGFLLERWIEGAPLAGVPGRAHLARYLGFRARALPADGNGAGPDELRRMATTNAAELGGDALAARVDDRLAGLDSLEPVPVRIDGRLHRWEWRRAAGGATIIKTDALDHAAAHDLVGCQDIAWDMAGAVVEFGLDAADAQALRRAVAEVSGRALPARAVTAYCLCYAAFQAGLWQMTGEGGPDGTPRTADEVARYRVQLCRAAGAALPAMARQ